MTPLARGPRGLRGKIAAAGLALGAVGLVGCAPQNSSTPGVPAASSPAGPSASPGAEAPQAPATEAGPDPRSAPTSPPSGTEFTFDQAARFPDGVQVQVSTIRADRTTPTQTGAEGTSGEVVIADILVTNNSTGDFDSANLRVWGYYDFVGAPKLDDSSGAVGDSFRGNVPPGGSAKAVMGFAMPHDRLGEVTIMIQRADANQSAVQFTGPVQ